MPSPLQIDQVAETGEPQAFSILDADFSREPYAFALPRNNADFRLVVNAALAKIYRTGEVDRILERWLGEDSEPTALLETVYFIDGFGD